MKKVTVLAGAVAAGMVTLLAAGPASAGSGEWDFVGVDEFTSQSADFSSGGGDFKVCLQPGSKEGDYRLMEDDPFNPDDLVPAPGTVAGLEFDYPYETDSFGCFVYRDIGSYVDGTNGKAEFYLIKWSGGNSTVEAWD